MKTYHYVTNSSVRDRIKTFKAEDDADFVKNLQRVESKPALFFSQDKSLVQKFLVDERLRRDEEEALKFAIPEEIVSFLSGKCLVNFQHTWKYWSVSLRKDFIAASYLNGKLKPYFVTLDWETGASYHFLTREEVIKEIIDQKKSVDPFDIFILSYPDGKNIEFNVEYNVTLKE